MPIPRYLRPALVVPMILAGLVASAPVSPGAPPSPHAPSVSAGSASADPAPVQLLDLTTQSGRPTEIARSGLDGARASGVAARANTGADGDPAAAPGAVGALTAAAGDVGPGTDVPGPGTDVADSGADDVDPERDAVILTDPLQVDDFLIAGFTWIGGESDAPPDGVHIYLRVRQDGQWSPWYLNEPSDAGRDDGVGRAGTDELVTGGADAVQASVVGDASALPADLTLALVPDHASGERDLGAADGRAVGAEPTGLAADEPADGRATAPGDEPAVSAVAAVQSDRRDDRGSAGAPAGASAARLPSVIPAAETDDPSALVTTREEWGANPAYLNWRPNYVPADHVIVHHTAGTNDYTPEQSPSIVRGIYYYHAVVLGWGDIGYNFLVDKYGQVFEGRYGTLDSDPGTMVVGGHAYGANTGTMGISMMGNYSSTDPSEIQIERVGQMAGWFLGRAGVVDAYGSSRFTFRATQKYRRGQTIDLDVISAHRDVGYTTCPGDAGYSMMDPIRSAAQDQIDYGAW